MLLFIFFTITICNRMILWRWVLIFIVFVVMLLRLLALWHFSRYFFIWLFCIRVSSGLKNLFKFSYTIKLLQNIFPPFHIGSGNIAIYIWAPIESNSILRVKATYICICIYIYISKLNVRGRVDSQLSSHLGSHWSILCWEWPCASTNWFL
jgi:hypothetical protein